MRERFPRQTYRAPEQSSAASGNCLPDVAAEDIAVFSPEEKIETCGRILLEDKRYESIYNTKIPHSVRSLAIMLIAFGRKSGLSTSDMGKFASVMLDLDLFYGRSSLLKMIKADKVYVPSSHRTALKWAFYAVELGVFSYGADVELRTRKIFYFNKTQKDQILTALRGRLLIENIVVAQLAKPTNHTAGRDISNKNFYVHILAKKEK